MRSVRETLKEKYPTTTLVLPGVYIYAPVEMYTGTDAVIDVHVVDLIIIIILLTLAGECCTGPRDSPRPHVCHHTVTTRRHQRRRRRRM
jgi:hypothetical protein